MIHGLLRRSHRLTPVLSCATLPPTVAPASARQAAEAVALESLRKDVADVAGKVSRHEAPTPLTLIGLMGGIGGRVRDSCDHVDSRRAPKGATKEGCAQARSRPAVEAEKASRCSREGCYPRHGQVPGENDPRDRVRGRVVQGAAVRGCALESRWWFWPETERSPVAWDTRFSPTPWATGPLGALGLTSGQQQLDAYGHSDRPRRRLPRHRGRPANLVDDAGIPKRGRGT